MFHQQYNASNGAAIAEERMAKALLSYEQWGAQAKIDQLAAGRPTNKSSSKGLWRDSSGFAI